MDEGSARTLLEQLGCKRIKVLGHQIQATCPFEENHYRGDRNPSFGARLDDAGKSPYFCHGCHQKGTLEWLAVDNGMENLVPDWKPKKIKSDRWMKKIPSTNRGGLFDYLYKEDKQPAFFNDIYLEPFTGVLSGALVKRGVTVETAKEWELGVDKENGRAIFVLRDVEGRVALVKGRDTTGRSKVKYIAYVLDKESHKLVPRIDYKREQDFKRPTKSLFLYGEYQAKKVLDGELERRSLDLVLVEGEVDVLKVWQWGWNVVGLIGSYPSDEQCEKIVKLIPKGGRLIVIMDNDKAGKKCVKELYEKLKDRVPFFNVVLPEGTDPAEMKSDIEMEKVISQAKLFFLTET